VRKVQVPLKRYASPEYLRELCLNVEKCYFSEDRDWRCIEAIFDVEIKKMEAREPRPPAAKLPPKKLIGALSRVADQLAKDGRR
jgi:hypothetical protein